MISSMISDVATALWCTQSLGIIGAYNYYGNLVADKPFFNAPASAMVQHQVCGGSTRSLPLGPMHTLPRLDAEPI